MKVKYSTGKDYVTHILNKHTYSILTFLTRNLPHSLWYIKLKGEFHSKYLINLLSTMNLVGELSERTITNLNKISVKLRVFFHSSQRIISVELNLVFIGRISA